MRSLVLLAVIAACGPSSAEIRTAQTATYRAPSAELYQLALEAAAQDYKIGETNPQEGLFSTAAQWYSPEGGRQSNGAGDFVQLDDRSVNLHLIVEIVELDDHVAAIRVTPKTFQHISGSPQPRELMADDPNLPGWVHGRVDSLQLAIYNRAKKYASQ